MRKKQRKRMDWRPLRKANLQKESGHRGNWSFGGIVRRFVRQSLKAFEEE